MICRKCRKNRHEKCRGGTYCDCQHLEDGVNWPLVQSPATQVVSPTTRPVDC